MWHEQCHIPHDPNCSCFLALPSSPSLPRKPAKSWEGAAARLRETTVNPGGSSYRGGQQTSCLHSFKAPLQRVTVPNKPRSPRALGSCLHGSLGKERNTESTVILFHPPSFWQSSAQGLLKHPVASRLLLFLVFIATNGRILHAFV